MASIAVSKPLWSHVLTNKTASGQTPTPCIKKATPSCPRQPSAVHQSPKSISQPGAAVPVWSRLFAASNGNRDSEETRTDTIPCKQEQERQLENSSVLAPSVPRSLPMSATELTEVMARPSETSSNASEASPVVEAEDDGPRRIVVDSLEDIDRLLNSMADLPSNPPSIYVDVEGRELGSHGVTCTLAFHLLPERTTYIVDLVKLGKSAFDTVGTQSGETLRGVLESSITTKVIFDARSQSNALFAHFGIRLSGVQEVQLMEVACRDDRSRRLLIGLLRCVMQCSLISEPDRASWIECKARYRELFNPAFGGDDQVLERRPIDPLVFNMAARNVECLVAVWTELRAKLSDETMKLVLTEGAARIEAAQAPGYQNQGPHMAQAPWALQKMRRSFVPYHGHRKIRGF